MHAVSILWSELNAFVLDQIQYEYHALFRGGILFAAAILFLTAALCLYFLQRAQRVGYVNRTVTPISYHLLLIAATALAALWLCWSMVQGQVSIIALLPVLVAAAGVAGLVRFRLYGPIASVLFFWCAGWILEQPRIASAILGRAELADYSAAGQTAVYIASDILILGAIGLEILLAAFTVFTVRYYTQRRFLFHHLKQKYFDPLTRCPKCGAAAVGTEPRCYSCSTDLSDTARTKLSFRLLDKPRYARKSLTDVIDETNKDKISGLVLPILFFAVIIAVAFVPIFFTNTTLYLTDGAAEARNTYAEKLVELYEDPSVTGDTEWAESFNAAASDLYDIDTRCFFINTRGVRASDLPVFIQYSEACVEQMLSMDDIASAINENDAGDLMPLLIRFDDSQTAQQNALTSSMIEAVSAITLKDRLSDYTRIFVNSLRFYTSFLPLTIWALIVLVLGVLFLFLAVRCIRKNRAFFSAPYEHPVLAEGSRDYTQEQADWQKHRKREQLLTAAVTVFFIAAMVLASHLGFGKTDEDLYPETLHAVTIEGPAAVEAWLGNARLDPEAVTDADLEELVSLLENQLSALDSLMSFEEDDIPENYRLIHEQLMSVASEVETGLSGLLSEAESGSPLTSAQISDGLAAETRLMSQGAYTALADVYGNLQELVS